MNIKPGYKTTEFWLTIIISLWAMLVADIPTPWNALVPMIAVSIYGIARSLAKAGFIRGEVGRYLKENASKVAGALAAILLLGSLSVGWAAYPASFTWGAVTTNTDGSVITDLAGYKIHCGSAPGAYTTTVDVGNVTNHIDDGTLISSGGEGFCAATAYDTAGNESPYSNEVRVDFLAPGAPANFQWG
jgi:hypothetical protein